MPSHSLKLHWLLPVTLLLGCPKDEGNGTGGSESSSGSTGDTAATMTSGVTVTTTMTTMDSMSASMTTMDTMTTMSTTDMTTADSSGTTDNPTGSESGSDSGSSGSDSGSSGSESSTGTVVPGTYPPCDFSDPENPTCADENDTCWQYMPENDMDTFHAWCAPACEMFMPDNCPATESGDAVVECSMLPGNPCALNCGGGETCPDGMECYDVPNFPISRCVWNIPQ